MFGKKKRLRALREKILKILEHRYSINPDTYERDLETGILAFYDRVDEYVALEFEENYAAHAVALEYLLSLHKRYSIEDDERWLNKLSTYLKDTFIPNQERMQSEGLISTAQIEKLEAVFERRAGKTLQSLM